MGGNPLDYLGVQDSTINVKGKVALATTAETVAGTNATKAVTPLGAASLVAAGAPDASEGTKGIAQLATTAEAQAGTNDTKIMTPLKASQKFAAPGAIGGTTPAAGTFTDLTADGTGTVTLTSNAASVYDVTGAGNDLTLSSDAGRVVINPEEAAADALRISSAAGGLDMDMALGIDIVCSQNAADAIIMNASAGGIDITAAGAAGEDIDIVCTSGSVNISGGENAADAVVISAGAGGIDISATGAAGEDIDIVNTGGSVNISATEDDAGAILIHANGGVSERILLHADQGTGVDSVELLSDLGGISLIATGLASADAINLSAPAGGVDIDGALQVNIASSQAAADAVRIDASNAAGGIDIDDGGGGITIDSADAISIDAAAASNFTTAGAGIDLTLSSAAGRVVVNGEEAAADAVRINSAAGGIDADCALQLSLISSQAAVANSVVIQASAADGGIDCDSGTGGTNIASTGVVDIDAAGALSLNSSAAAINLGDDAIAQAINIGTGAAARTITIGNGTAATSLVLDCGTGALNIGTNAIARTVTVGNTTGASALVLSAGTGDITVNGTVKEIDAEFLFSSGTDLTVTQSPIVQSNATTGVAPTGVDGDVNLMYMQDGCLMEQFIIGTQTIIAPRMSATGLDIELDNTNAEGAEYNFGARNNAKHAYTIGTSAAFFVEAQFTVEDLSGCAPLMIGFRKVEANNKVIANYTDYFCAGLNSATSALNVVLLDELNGGGQTATDSTDAWTGGDTGTATIRVLVSASGVCTYTIDGVAPSVTNAMTFDNTDVVMPFIHFLNGADVAGAVSLNSFKCGFQA